MSKERPFTIAHENGVYRLIAFFQKEIFPQEPGSEMEKVILPIGTVTLCLKTKGEKAVFEILDIPNKDLLDKYQFWYFIGPRKQKYIKAVQQPGE